MVREEGGGGGGNLDDIAAAAAAAAASGLSGRGRSVDEGAVGAVVDAGEGGVHLRRVTTDDGMRGRVMDRRGEEGALESASARLGICANERTWGGEGGGEKRRERTAVAAKRARARGNRSMLIAEIRTLQRLLRRSSSRRS